MSAASNYTEANIMNAMLHGQAYPLPAGTYVSLHTANPGDTGASEVSTTAWPAYVRKHAEDGGVIGTGWTAPADGVCTNTKQLIYPSNNGVSNVQVTHFGVWDAATGGNLLFAAALYDVKNVGVGDVFVFDVGSITARAL